MDQRKRLIELLFEAEGQVNNDLPSLEQIADYLLAYGVIVPPVKVGGTVYQTDGIRIYESKVKAVIYNTSHYAFDERAIGKMVFLTKEEAEAALAERSNR